MTERERLQCAYELAFHPPRLHEAWEQIKRDAVGNREQIGQLLDLALLLHQALPEEGYASQRALNRLALYQAKARAFGMVRFLRNIRRHLRRPPLDDRVVPAHLVRDIAIPQIARVPARKQPKIWHGSTVPTNLSPSEGGSEGGPPRWGAGRQGSRFSG